MSNAAASPLSRSPGPTPLGAQKQAPSGLGGKHCTPQVLDCVGWRPFLQSPCRFSHLLQRGPRGPGGLLSLSSAQLEQAQLR